MPRRHFSDSEPTSEEIPLPNLPRRLRRAVVSESSEAESESEAESRSGTESDSETEESESEFEFGLNGFFDDEAEECVFCFLFLISPGGSCAHGIYYSQRFPHARGD